MPDIILFTIDKGDNGLGFAQDDITFYNNGTLSANAHSYPADDFGHIELTEKETFKLYKIMANYFRNS